MSPEQGGFAVDIWPTGRCDHRCPFCYGADRPVIHPGKPLEYAPTPQTIAITGSSESRGEASVDDIKRALSMLVKAGLNILNVGGGEPLMRPETPEIIRFAKKDLGLTVYLSTNGTFLSRRYDEIKDCIDILGLPLDGSTPEGNIKMGRREYLHDNIAKILTTLKAEAPKHKVKIGTVVSEINADDMVDIGEFLFRNPEFYRPEVWRVYQFEALKKGLQNKEKYQISDERFENVCGEIRTKFPDVAINPRSNKDHSNAYFFMTPDGMLQIVNNIHESIADLTTVTQEELSRLIGERSDTVNRAAANRDWVALQ